MAGLMEGYMAGLQAISGLEQMRRSREEFDFRKQQAEKTAWENEQEKSILARVFKSQADQVGVTDQLGSQDRLAQQMQQAGSAVMRVNPKTGMSLLKQADDMRLRVQQASVEQIQAVAARDRLLAGKAGTVTDQDSLSALTQEMAKAGKTIPARYQVWNEDTKAWLDRQAMLGVTGFQKQELDIKTKKEQLEEQRQKLRDRREDDRMKIEATKEARLQRGLDIREGAAKNKAINDLSLRTKADREAEITVLTDLGKDTGFKDLAPGLKLEAANDVRMRAQKLYADSLAAGEGLEISKEDALATARQQVLGEIQTDPNAWYNIFTKPEVRRERGPESELAPRKAGGGAPAGQPAGPEPIGKQGISPMPTSKDALTIGQIYSTARGPALWKGDHFESLK
jgi:hypothetical protein